MVRSEEGLRQGLAKVAELRVAAAHVDVRPDAEGYQDLAHALDLRASLTAAEATLRAALERRESRGAHQRADYPALDPALAVNVVVTQADGGLTVSRAAVPAVPDHLHEWATATAELPTEGRLLE